GELFILDMGQPVKIADLARDMIRLSGASEYEIPIVYTGIRPGEKLFEELTLDEEEVDKTSHEKIFIGRRNDGPALRDFLVLYRELLGAAFDGHEIEVRRLLRLIIPTYHHPEIPENVVSIKRRKATG
ncbi:MAG: polysaccharide biosynthesis protein, partial [Bradymonadaceae bacterium]